MLNLGYILGKHGKENVFILNKNQIDSSPLFYDSLFCEQMDLSGGWKSKVTDLIMQLGFEIPINERKRQKWRKLFDDNNKDSRCKVFIKEPGISVIEDVMISCDPENRRIAQNIASELERLGIKSDFLFGSQNDARCFINDVINADNSFEFNSCCLMLFGENRAKRWSEYLDNINSSDLKNKSKMSKFIFVPTDEKCMHFRRLNDVILKNNYIYWKDNPADIAEDLKKKIEHYKGKEFAHVNGFSPFELKVIHLMCRGDENNIIAQKLSLKQGLVDKCVSDIKIKSKTKTIAELKKYIFENDISI